MSKPAKIHVVEIATKDPAQKIKHFVRHNTPAAARNWLLENAVTERVATQEDIIEMVSEGVQPIGPFENIAEPDTAQADAFENESRN